MNHDIEAVRQLMAATLPSSQTSDAADIGEIKAKAFRAALKKLPASRRQFLGEYDVNNMDSRERDKLTAALASGKYAKPSDYVATLDWIWGDFIPGSAKAEALAAVDRCLTRPYGVHLLRRSLRSSDMSAYDDRIRSELAGFAQDVLLPYDLAGILTGHVPPEVTRYLGGQSWYHRHAALPSRIAGALDRGDAAVEAAVRDILVGDGKATLMREVIQGVVQSGRSDMHALLGQLLLAARLQEGLRQVICENADMGTKAAFMTLLSVIADNDLIRFSAVKRAVHVWLGLQNDDGAVDLERVSSKSIQLIRRCLTEDAFREECLASEDCMAIHIGLWAIGFHDVQQAIRRAEDMALHSSHHQRLVCAYFAASLDEPDTASRLARRVIAAFPGEMDTLALYLPLLIRHLVYRLWSVGRGHATLPPLTDYFADEAECRRMIDLLLDVRKGLKKPMVFDPCVFPWYSARLDKGLVSERIFSAALLTRDDALIDSLLPLLPECPVDSSRDNLLRCLCAEPKTPARRKALLNALCDKGEWIRRTAAEMAEKLTLIPADVPVLEDQLRFRYADARPKMMTLLLQQGDDDLCATVRRLLGDKLEERRIAALDMVHTVVRSGKRPSLTERFRPLLTAMDAPSAKEKPLLEAIRAMMGEKQDDKPAPDPLFTGGETFVPKPIDVSGLADAVATWTRYFPDSKLPQELEGKKPGLLKRLFAPKASTESRDQAQADIASLTRLVLEHHNDTVTNHLGEESLLGSIVDFCRSDLPGGVLLRQVWDDWYATQLGSDPTRLMRACILINTRRDAQWAGEIQLLFGAGFDTETLHHEASRAGMQILLLLVHLVKAHVPVADRHQLALSLMCWLVMCAPENKLLRTVTRRHFPTELFPLRSLEVITVILSGLSYRDDATFPIAFNAVLLLHARMAKARERLLQAQPDLHDVSAFAYSPLGHHCPTGQTLPNIPLLLLAAFRGHMPRQAVYAMLRNGVVDRRQGMMHLSLLSSYHRLQGARPAADRWGTFERMRRELQSLYLGHETPEREDDAALLSFADEVCQPLLARIIDAEIRRGDAPGDFTPLSAGVTRVDSAEAFVRILAALGKDKLVRTSGSFFSSYTPRASRTESLCGLLRRCVPLEGDTADTLRALVQQHDVKPARLIEAALYVPAWIELCEEALQMPGFTSAAYYFIAHMNEEFDEARMARIARFTPLTAEELQNGAFDINWFRSACGTLGEKQFDLFYDAAKYIADGAKHARARKYADAALGRLDPAAVQREIAEKRNKDLLRAYPLIPLQGEEDVQARYLYIQQFLRESRTFGAQRAASEKAAVEIALQNLAMNAGYADAMRLTLRMETRLTEENADLFAPHVIDGVTLCLTVDDQGLAAIECLKGGKALKSIPAKIRKDPFVLRLTDMKKQLTEQHRRARRMLEEAMETSAAFTAGEIAALMANPVIAPMLAKLVFMAGERFGFTDGLTLTDAAGASAPLDPTDTLVIAHPYHLWQAKVWLAYQQRLFDGRIVQPIRQVFRELYVSTPEELPRTTSLRYSGHQLQPKRTLACLKTRRWIADPEAGLQKVYYRENIIATIWALADWFTPADIEAPTLEHVAFLDRKSGRPIAIRDVPPVLFSEVMRDVDLAVSVAHAGGIDPECSHSTIEMRAALLAFTLPLFRLDNVRIEGSHALIEGTLARYSVHLGSGVVHQRGGTMLSVIPVHGQHRGRLFLPFADDDPKTAEILSKVLLFAEDGKIKDPTILEQIIKS